MWDGTAGNIVTFDFPKASRLKLIQNAPEHPVNYIYRVSAGIHPNFKPRSCQEDAKNAFLQNDFSCLFMMATGSGKTKAAMYAISQIDPWKLLLICVPSLELVEQWKRMSTCFILISPLSSVGPLSWSQRVAEIPHPGALPRASRGDFHL